MFETELIRYLQSFSSDWLTILMLIITSLGSSPVHSVMIIAVMLGVSFRKGFFLAHIVIWAAMLTDLAKNLFGLPRPFQVDAGVDRPDISRLTGGETSSLFQTLYRRVIDIYGEGSGASYGFPSGHVSATTSIWGGLSMLFESRAARAITVPLIAFMAVSRMYLGRHFPADVIGGLVLGAIVLLVSWLLLDRAILPPASGRKSIALYIYLLLVPFLLLALAPRVDAEDAGRLLGLNAAFLLVSSRGLPSDSGSRKRRAARVILGLLFLALTRLVFITGSDLLSLEDSIGLRFAQEMVSHFLLIWAAVEVGTRLNLFTMEADTPRP
jgi:membrane-associated phospholipid phosphatase